MSIADAQRVITLVNRVYGLAVRNRVLVARVAALEDHLADFRAAVEARQTLETSTAGAAPASHIPTPQQPLNTPVGDAKTCPSCAPTSRPSAGAIAPASGGDRGCGE